MKKTELILINMINLCTKFDDFNMKNEFRNAKRGRLIEWSSMRIFNEAESPWSNSSEILG